MKPLRRGMIRDGVCGRGPRMRPWDLIAQWDPSKDVGWLEFSGDVRSADGLTWTVLHARGTAQQVKAFMNRMRAEQGIGEDMPARLRAAGFAIRDVTPRR